MFSWLGSLQEDRIEGRTERTIAVSLMFSLCIFKKNTLICNFGNHKHTWKKESERVKMLTVVDCGWWDYIWVIVFFFSIWKKDKIASKRYPSLQRVGRWGQNICIFKKHQMCFRYAGTVVFGKGVGCQRAHGLWSPRARVQSHRHHVSDVGPPIRTLVSSFIKWSNTVFAKLNENQMKYHPCLAYHIMWFHRFSSLPWHFEWL